MDHNQVDAQQFSLYASLPFVSLADENLIRFGPVNFFPVSLATESLLGVSYSSFQEYIQILGQLKAAKTGEGREPEQNISHIGAAKVWQENMTCISVADEIAPEVKELLLLDAIYLLYFACTFRHLYYGQPPLEFHAFRKIIPASISFIENKKLWEEVCIHESDREDNVSVHIIDPDICRGLGMALEAIYHPSSAQDQDRVRAYKRIVRSIRYMVDRSFPRFINLIDRGLCFSDEMFESESVLFLTASFESLFDLNGSQEIAADFKHQLRPLLHLKYTRPVEIFWKWVDDFYALKRQILNGETFIDPIYRYNPNFEVSHILLGIKLFVYAIYYYLYSYELLESKHVDPYTPPDFKWIHPEEILLFFWTETAVLEKILLITQQCSMGVCKEEARADVSLLTTLFVSLYDRYYLSAKPARGESAVHFIPTPLVEITQNGNAILALLEEMKSKDPANIELQYVHPYFTSVLTDRLQEKKL